MGQSEPGHAGVVWLLVTMTVVQLCAMVSFRAHTSVVTVNLTKEIKAISGALENVMKVQEDLDEELRVLEESHVRKLLEFNRILTVGKTSNELIHKMREASGDRTDTHPVSSVAVEASEQQTLTRRIAVFEEMDKKLLSRVSNLSSSMDRMQTKLVGDVSKAFDDLACKPIVYFIQRAKVLQQIEDRMKQAMNNRFANMVEFLHRADLVTTPEISISTSISRCNDGARDPMQCELPVSITRRSVTITATCDVLPKLGKHRTAEVLGHYESLRPVLRGPPKFKQLAGGAFLHCSQPARMPQSFADSRTCTVQNLTRTTSYIINFKCSWLGIKTSKAVIVRVMPELVVGLDIGTQTMKVVYYNEMKQLRLVQLGKVSHGFLPSTLSVCQDRLVVGAEDPPGDDVRGCCTVEDVKGKLGYYEQLCPLDICTPDEGDAYQAVKIEPKCLHSAQSSKKCDLTVARWNCSHEQGSGLQQEVETIDIMASFIKYVTTRVQRLLGGGPVSFAYTSPFEFRQHQSRAFFDAIRIAGTDNTQMLLHIPETMAATAYIFHHLPILYRSIVLVIDFGHGHTGINLLSTGSRYGLKVIRGKSIPNCSGRRFDRALAELINSQLNETGQKERITPREAEMIKKQVNRKGKVIVKGVAVTLKTLEIAFELILKLPLQQELHNIFSPSVLRSGENFTTDGIHFSYEDLQVGRGLVLVVGGMSKLKCLQTFLLSFFRHKSAPDRPIRVEFVSQLEDNSNDEHGASSLSIAAKGAALLSALHTGLLKNPDLGPPLQPLTDSRFMSIRIREMTKGAARCKLLTLVDGEHDQELNWSQHTGTSILMNTTADSDHTYRYINMQNALCQSTDSFSSVTNCADCVSHVILENPLIPLEKNDSPLVNVTVNAIAKQNGTLKLFVNIFNVKDTLLQLREVELHISNGYYSEEELQIHRESVQKIMQPSKYPACWMPEVKASSAGTTNKRVGSQSTETNTYPNAVQGMMKAEPSTVEET